MTIVLNKFIHPGLQLTFARRLTVGTRHACSHHIFVPMHDMNPPRLSSLSSSAASYIDDSQSLTDESLSQGRPAGSSRPSSDHRTSTPSSWYAELATEPPRAEDFIIYDDHIHDNQNYSLDGQSVSQSSDVSGFINETLPTDEELAAAGDFLLYDADRKPCTFKSLYTGPDNEGTRQLIVFIRHFYCGVCILCLP